MRSGVTVHVPSSAFTMALRVDRSEPVDLGQDLRVHDHLWRALSSPLQQRKHGRRADEWRGRSFTGRYNQTARPFNWKYTAADLARFLGRISGHQEPASLLQAA